MPASMIVRLPVEPWTPPDASVVYPIAECKNRVSPEDFSCAIRIRGKQLLKHATVYGLSAAKLLEMMPYILGVEIWLISTDRMEIGLRVPNSISPEQLCADLAKLLSVTGQGLVSFVHFGRAITMIDDEYPCWAVGEPIRAVA